MTGSRPPVSDHQQRVLAFLADREQATAFALRQAGCSLRAINPLMRRGLITVVEDGYYERYRITEKGRRRAVA